MKRIRPISSAMPIRIKRLLKLNKGRAEQGPVRMLAQKDVHDLHDNNGRQARRGGSKIVRIVASRLPAVRGSKRAGQQIKAYQLQ